MTRKLLVAVLVTAFMSVGGSAFAQGGVGKVKTKFYNFDDMLIDGEIKKPSGLLTDVRKSARFRRLLDLKKSFLPILEKTAKEKTLK